MIKNADAAVLADMTSAIVDTVRPMQVVVFGSHARGDATADSDIDLLVVEAEPFTAMNDEAMRLIIPAVALASLALKRLNEATGLTAAGD
jgi:predicted nucleotidyltransferase